MDMKRLTIALIGVLSAVSLVFPAFASSSMTEKEAKETARKAVPADSKVLKSEFDDGIYEIKFYQEKNQMFYEIKVNPNTKKITEYESKLVDDDGSKKVTLSETQAKKVVTDECEKATILTVGLEKDDGKKRYVVAFETGSYYGKYYIHPETGSILKRDIKLEKPASASNQNIGTEKAKSIAQKQAPGATLVKCKFDIDDGQAIYEVELVKGHWEYEYEIDAYTGEILKSETDYDD